MGVNVIPMDRERVLANQTVVVRNGVIADLEVAEHMIKHFVNKARATLGRRKFKSPEIVICVPSGSTSVERRAMRDAASNAGARQWVRLQDSVLDVEP